MRLKPIVLSIDDDVITRNIIEHTLNRFGLIIRSVSGAEEFLKLAEEMKPDLYLIDLQLAESNGLDLITTIRNDIDTKAVIVVISGNKQLETITHALEMGANDYILKPLDRVLMATKLSQYFETDAMSEHCAKLHRLTGKRPANLDIDGAISEVDELGVKFNSSTLISKGTSLKMKSDLFKTMGLSECEYLVTVTSNWLIPETHRYGGYAEFKGVDVEFLRRLRVWLTQEGAKTLEPSSSPG